VTHVVQARERVKAIEKITVRPRPSERTPDALDT
jgi:hypothetical protein